jgi:imidazoleglycerol-phosphate dehydratase/histidinol-phosphatase
MFGKYLGDDYDLGASFVIGDRETDMELAHNLGATGILVSDKQGWNAAVERIRSTERCAEIARKTSETDVYVRLDLDGKGLSEIDTGLKFLDHMLNQLVHHGGLSLTVRCKGDLEVDEHHTMEDIGIAIGEALKAALGDKRGIERYGFALPMDESSALVLLDFGGRSELVWNVTFTREYVGDVPTEMFRHFFKSLSDAARCNLRIDAAGENNHHIAEAVFKAFARAVRQAVKRDVFSYELPSSKGVL